MEGIWPLIHSPWPDAQMGVIYLLICWSDAGHTTCQILWSDGAPSASLSAAQMWEMRSLVFMIPWLEQKGKILSSKSPASQGNHSLQGAAQSYRGWRPLGPYPPGTLWSEEEGQHLPMERHRDGVKTGGLLLQRQPASARAEGVVAWFGFIDSGGSQEALSQLVERGKSRCSQSHSCEQHTWQIPGDGLSVRPSLTLGCGRGPQGGWAERPPRRHREGCDANPGIGWGWG